LPEQNKAEEIRDLIDQAAANCRSASHMISSEGVEAPWAAQVEQALEQKADELEQIYAQVEVG
jgi:hypothetical protein